MNVFRNGSQIFGVYHKKVLVSTVNNKMTTLVQLMKVYFMPVELLLVTPGRMWSQNLPVDSKSQSPSGEEGGGVGLSFYVPTPLGGGGDALY